MFWVVAKMFCVVTMMLLEVAKMFWVVAKRLLRCSGWLLRGC